MFLTIEQLRSLTGRVKRSAQVRVLEAQKIPFVLDADGYPKVLAEAVKKRLLGSDVLIDMQKRAEPDFSVFKVRIV